MAELLGYYNPDSITNSTPIFWHSSSGAWQKLGKTFTTPVDISWDIEYIKVKVLRTGTIGNALFKITSTTAFNKPQNDILGSELVNVSGVTTDGAGEWLQVTFGPSVEIPVNTGFGFTIEPDAAWSVSGGNSLKWGTNTAAQGGEIGPTYNWVSSGTSPTWGPWNSLGFPNKFLIEIWGTKKTIRSINSTWLSSNGDFVVVAADNGVFLSTDFGDNWTRKTPDDVEDTDWEKGICSSTGTYIIVVSDADANYRSANSGSSWAEITPADGDTFSVNKMATSDDGQFMVIVGQNSTDATESCYISTDYGATWAAKKPVAASIEYTECDISNDGTVIAVSTTEDFFISLDSGATWMEQGMASTAEVWKGLSISGDGTTGLVANTNDNDEFFIGINTELFSRATWAESTITSAGRALIDDATVADQNTTLGFGTGDSPTLTGLILSGLTETRVVFVGAGGPLTDDANLTFSGATLSATNVTSSGTVQAEQLTSTDDITMLGHLFTAGDAGSATDTVFSFLNSNTSTTMTAGDGLVTFSHDLTFGDDSIPGKAILTWADSIGLGTLSGGGGDFIFSNTLQVQGAYLVAGGTLIAVGDTRLESDTILGTDNSNTHLINSVYLLPQDEGPSGFLVSTTGTGDAQWGYTDPTPAAGPFGHWDVTAGVLSPIGIHDVELGGDLDVAENLTVGDTVNPNSGGIGLFVSTQNPVLTIRRDLDVALSSLAFGALLERTAGVETALDNIGIGFVFKAPNDAGEDIVIGSFGGRLSDVSAGSEIGKLVFAAVLGDGDASTEEDLIILATTSGAIVTANDEFRVRNSALIGFGTSGDVQDAGPQEKLHVFGDGAEVFALIQNSRSNINDLVGIKFSTYPAAAGFFAKTMIVHQDVATFGRGDLLFCVNNVSTGSEVTVADKIMKITSAGVTVTGTTNLGDGTNETIIDATGSITQAGSADATLNLTISSTQTKWDAAYDNMVTALAFNTGDGIITITQQDSGTLTTDSLDGRYPTRAEWLQNGFPNRTDSSISFNDGTRRFTINPSGSSFNYFMAGVKYTVSSSDVENVNYVYLGDTPAEGPWYIYYDGSTLTAIASPNNAAVRDIYENKAMIAIVFWDADNTKGQLLEDRHGLSMSPLTHILIHETVGARFNIGLALNSITVDENGSANSHAQFGVDAGQIFDEDIEHTLNAIGSGIGLQIWYRDTSGWTFTTNAGFSMVTTGTGRLAYDNNGTLAEVSNGDYVLCHIFASSMSHLNPVVAIGQTEYSTKKLAQQGALTEIVNILAIANISPELKPIASVIFRTWNNYTNDVKAIIVSTDEGGDYVDFRTDALNPAFSSAQNHGNLAGLTNDDHTQYHTDGRAATWLAANHETTFTHADIATNMTHISSNGSDHTFLDQSVVNGATPVFTGTSITGIPAASILAGTLGTGDYAINGAFTIRSSGDPILILRDTSGSGDVQTGWVAFHDDSDTEKGFFGFGSSGNQDFSLFNRHEFGKLNFYTNSILRITVHQGGKVGIDDNSPSFKLDVNGDGRFTGKLTTLGSVDPPGVLYDSESRISTVARVKREVPKNKLNGCFMFYNGESGNMELYFPITGEFKNFNGELIDQIEPIIETFTTVDKYHLDELIGEVIKTQVEALENKKYKIKKSYSLDSKTGKFYNEQGKKVKKSMAVEYINKGE